MTTTTRPFTNGVNLEAIGPIVRLVELRSVGGDGWLSRLVQALPYRV